MSQQGTNKAKRRELSPAEIRALWQQLTITHLDERNEDVEELLRQLRLIYSNGGAAFAKFHLTNIQILHESYRFHTPSSHTNFFDTFLPRPEVRAALPALQIKGKLRMPLEVQQSSAFVLDGEFAWCLAGGGAYARFNGTARQAKAIGQKAADALTGGRYDEIRIFKTFQPWSPWFHDVAWDYTWFGVDEINENEAYLWMLCATDTD